MPFFVYGLDLGQAQDYTANVVLEVCGTQRKVDYEGLHEDFNLPATKRLHCEVMPIQRMDVRHVQRYPLGMPYREIARDIEAKLRKTGTPRYLALDRTGAGIPIMDEVFQHLDPIGVTITTGRDVSMVDAAHWHVPKVDLVTIVQMLLQERRLRIGKGATEEERLQVEYLTKELREFRYKMNTKTGSVVYEAWRERDHDDLVLACAIAAWIGRQVLIQNTARVETHIQTEWDNLQRGQYGGFPD